MPAYLPLLRVCAARLLAAIAALLLGGALALAQEAAPVDPPTRIARFDSISGGARQQSAADGQTRAADPNWPIAAGDRVWTDPAARAVVDAGGASLRLDGGTAIAFTALDDGAAQIQLTQGTLGVRLYGTDPNQRYEIDTPNLALVLVRPGTYRLDVDPSQGLTRVSVLPGASAIAYGESGQSLAMEGGQRRDFVGRGLGSPGLLHGIAGDTFDGWQADLDRAADLSVSAGYVSRDLPGYQLLDNYGDWQNDDSYGAVWFPRTVVGNWAPYRYGHWEWIAPWGWTWIDDAPWGFTPFHYGRWAQFGGRWGWVPGRPVSRPVYSPALVGFIGVGGGTVAMGSGRPGVAWFPLAPGERWRPAFRASPGYLERLNRAGQVREHGDQYQFQSRPAAVTALPADSFGNRGRDQRLQMEALTATTLAHARPVAPPPFSGAMAGSRPGVPPPQPFRLPEGRPMPPSVSMADQLRQQQAERLQRQQWEHQQRQQFQQQPFQDAQQHRPPPGYDPQRGQVERQQRELQMQQERLMQMQREQAARQQDMQMRQRMEQMRAEQQQRQLQQAQQQQMQQQQMQQMQAQRMEQEHQRQLQRQLQIQQQQMQQQPRREGMPPREGMGMMRREGPQRRPE